MSGDWTSAVDAAARAMFDRQQAGRMDAARMNPTTGQPWTFDDLPKIDQHGWRCLALPIVTAAAPFIHCECTDEHEATP